MLDLIRVCAGRLKPDSHEQIANRREPPHLQGSIAHDLVQVWVLMTFSIFGWLAFVHPPLKFLAVPLARGQQVSPIPPLDPDFR